MNDPLDPHTPRFHDDEQGSNRLTDHDTAGIALMVFGAIVIYAAVGYSLVALLLSLFAD